MIDFKKCDKIFDFMKEKHTVPCQSEYAPAGHKSWGTGARAMEAELSAMRYEEKITPEEVTYIFGMICTSALMNGHGDGDFFRP